MKDFDKIIGRDAITLIYFFCSDCVPCEAMEPALEEFADKMRGRVEVYRINTDSQEDAHLLYRYFIRTTPTIIFFRSSDVIWRNEGPMTRMELQAILEQIEEFEQIYAN